MKQPGALFCTLFFISSIALAQEPRDYCDREEMCPEGINCCTDDILKIHFLDDNGSLSGHSRTVKEGDRFTVAVTLDITSPNLQNFWGYTVRHDTTILNIESATIDGTDALEAFDSGFQIIGLAFKGETPNQGFGHGTALCFGCYRILPVQKNFTMSFATYTVIRAPEHPSLIQFVDEEFSLFPNGQPVHLHLDIEGSAVYPNKLMDAAISSQPIFRRGDANADGKIALVDAVLVLRSHFSQIPPQIDCRAVQDVNDDTQVTIADPVFLLNWLFRRGGRPSEPFLNCGFADGISCGESNCN